MQSISALSELVHLVNLDISSNQISELSALTGMRDLVYLYASDNRIADLTPLSGLSNLYLFYAQQNQIVDLTPLVQNAGIASMDLVLLSMNPVGCVAQANNIAAIQGRGVTLLTDCP